MRNSKMLSKKDYSMLLLMLLTLKRFRIRIMHLRKKKKRLQRVVLLDYLAQILELQPTTPTVRVIILIINKTMNLSLRTQRAMNLKGATRRVSKMPLTKRAEIK